MVFLNPRFLGMANHLGPFTEATDGHEGQEQPVQAVGGQGELREVTQPTSMLDTCFFKSYVFGTITSLFY